ncbi:MAG: S8 family serine peptidase [Myxococcaceae bacterium]|nr:S8 family serine peptidase [Myxococcaceae bacterium]
MRILLLPPILILAVTCACTTGPQNHDDPFQRPPPPPPPSGDGGKATLSGSLVVSSATSASARAEAADVERTEPGRQLLGPVRDSKMVRKVATPKPVTHAPPRPEYIPGDIIVRFEEENLSPTEVLERLRGLPIRCAHGGYASPFLHLLRCTGERGEPLDVGQSLEWAQTIGKLPGVRFAEVARRAHVQAIPADNLYPLQWHYPLLNLPAAWDLTKGSSSIAVAVVDTGIRPHPDLDGNVVVTVDMISDPDTAMDGDGRDLDGTDPGGDRPNGGSSFHGTHVAGTIAALANGKGVVGVAPQVSLVIVRALGKGGGSTFDIAAGIYWAAGGQVPEMPNNPRPAKVINLSLGGEGGPSQTFQDVIDAAVGAGSIVVVAAGNEDDDAANYSPANQDKVICVGATGLNGKVTQYSNYGDPVDVMAPGGDMTVDLDGDGYPDGVLSTYVDASSGSPNYEFLQGTSMATPHVSGVVALMASVDPTITASKAEGLLRSTANPASKCQWGCGAGMVDSYQAVSAAKGASSGSGAAKLQVASTSLALLPNAATSLLVTNTGGQRLTVSAQVSGAIASRINLTNGSSLALDAGKSGAFQVYVDASGLAEGEYTATVSLTSNGGNVNVAAILRIAPVAEARAALVAALFQDPSGAWQVADAAMSDPSKSQAWSLSVPAGSYFLIAWVDTNDDGEVGDDEPVGFYESMENPVPVTVTAGEARTGLTFAVLPQRSVGDPPPAAPVGDACTADADCASQLCATDWPGGYCTQECSNSACPGGSVCVAFSTGDFCMEACPAPGGGQSTCRSGYSCVELTNGEGACLPE